MLYMHVCKVEKDILTYYDLWKLHLDSHVTGLVNMNTTNHCIMNQFAVKKEKVLHVVTRKIQTLPQILTGSFADIFIASSVNLIIF